MIYTPQNWYWIVAGSTTQVYSSASASYVPVTDATYEAWLAAGNLPTKIDTEANLQGVFAAQYPAGWTLSAAQVAVNAGQATLANGIVITSTAFPNLNATYALTANTLLYVTGAVSYCLLKNQFPGNSATFTFFDEANTLHVFTTIAEFEAFAEAIASYFDPIMNYINSGGTQGVLPTSNFVTIA